MQWAWGTAVVGLAHSEGMDGSRSGRWTAQDELILRAAERLRRGLQRHPRTGLLQFKGSRCAEALNDVIADFGPIGLPVSVVLADLDQFDVFNGNYGHPAGDDALGSVGHALRELIRPLDMVMTTGSDAFLVVLLGADLRVAASRAEEARATIQQLHLLGAPTGVTASLGVAAHTGTETALELFERAYQAELRAKRLGRNRVEVARTGS